MLSPKLRWFVYSLSFLLLSTAPFCFWFKLQQLLRVAGEAPTFYPVIYWLEAVLLGVLLFSCLYLAWCLFWNLIFKMDIRTIALNCLGFMPLNLVWCGVSLKTAFFLTLATHLVLILFAGGERRISKTRLWQHLSALVIIILVQVFSLHFVSPLNWDNPIAGIRRYESAWTMNSSPMFTSNYSDAKRFELLSFNQSLWGASPRGIAFDSFFVSFAALFFDLPIIDIEAFVRLSLMMFFAVSILGCFGFYLYLIYALKIQPEFALIGGSFFVLLNPFFSTLFTQYFPSFIAPYFLFPYSLLLLHFASEARRLSLFISSGACLALNLYFVQSHPDTVYQAYGMLCIFALSYVWKHKKEKLFALFIIPSVGVGLGAGSLLSLGGIFGPILRQELRVYGHQRIQNFAGGFTAGLNHFILSPLRGFFLLIPLLILGCAVIKKFGNGDPARKRTFNFLLVLLVLFFITLVPGSDGPFAWILKKFSVSSLSFGHYGRVGTYYGLVLWVLFCICGNALFLRMDSPKISEKRWLFILMLTLAIFALGFILRKQHVLSEYYPFQFLLLIGGYAFSRGFGHYRSRQQQFCFLGLLLVFAYIGSEQSLFSWTSAKTEGNSKNCKPYLALDSLVMKAKLFPEDKDASTALIRSRLKTYELDSGQGIERESFDNPIALEEQLLKKIDNFYLNEYFCSFAPDKEQSIYGRTQFNHGLLFRNIGTKIQPIRIGITPFEHYAIGNGLRTINLDLSPDLKFMGVFPPINALYAIPGHLFNSVGSYESMGAGNVKAEGILNPEIRKIYGIAGVDIQVVDQSAVDEILREEDVELIPSGVPESIPTPYAVFRDKRSYGVAYLASRIQYVDPKEVLLKKFHPPFSNGGPQYFESYRENVSHLSKKLLALDKLHSAYVEDETKLNLSEEGSSKNRLEVLSLRNNKAAFEVECQLSPCRLVYNQAAVSGWTAYSDGLTQKIQPANFAFLSTEVPLGRHFVFFEYRPIGELIGMFLTLFLYALILAWSLYRKIEYSS